MIFNTVIRGSGSNGAAATINPYLEEVYIDENWIADSLGGLYNAYNLKKITIELSDTVPEVSYPFGALFGEKEFENTYCNCQSIITNDTSGDLKNYYIPNSIKSLRIKKGVIPKGFCMDIPSLETLIIDDDCTEIQAFAFNRCVNLKTVYLGKNVQKIHFSAFSACPRIEHVHFAQTEIVPSIDITETYLPNDVQEITLFPIDTLCTFASKNFSTYFDEAKNQDILDSSCIGSYDSFDFYFKYPNYFSLEEKDDNKRTATLIIKKDLPVSDHYDNTSSIIYPTIYSDQCFRIREKMGQSTIFEVIGDEEINIVFSFVGGDLVYELLKKELGGDENG